MKSIAALVLCLLTSVASAQPVYRCGNTYSRVPCPAGGKIVEATDPRSAAQRAEARRIATDERRLAAQMRRDRLADEKATKPAGATSLSGPAPAASTPAAAPHHKKKRGAAKPTTGADVILLSPGGRKQRGGS